MKPDDPQYLQYLRLTFCIGNDVPDSDVQKLVDQAERTVASVQTRRRLGLRDHEDATSLYEVVVNRLDRARHLKRNTHLANSAYGDGWIEEMEGRSRFALLCIQIVAGGTPLEVGLTAHFAKQPSSDQLAQEVARLAIESLKLHQGADRDIGITDRELVDLACIQLYKLVTERLPLLEAAADRG